MAAHRYWRILVERINGGTQVGIAEIELRTAIGGADQTGSGTASASSTSGAQAASLAFDNNAATYWLSSGNVPQSIVYDFGAGNDKDIVEFGITGRTGGTGTQATHPVDFKLQYSDDNSSWTTLIAIGGETNLDFSGGVMSFYSASDTMEDPADASGRSWRLRTTAVNGGTVLQLAEIAMYPTGSATDATAPGGSIYSSSKLQGVDLQAFDDILFTLTSYWMARAVAEWIGFKFAAPQTIAVIAITCYTGAGSTSNAPKDFVVEYWNGSAWVAAMTLTGITGWAQQQTRYFNSSGETTAPVGSSARPQVFVVT